MALGRIVGAFCWACSRLATKMWCDEWMVKLWGTVGLVTGAEETNNGSLEKRASESLTLLFAKRSTSEIAWLAQTVIALSSGSIVPLWMAHVRALYSSIVNNTPTDWLCSSWGCISQNHHHRRQRTPQTTTFEIWCGSAVRFYGWRTTPRHGQSDISYANPNPLQWNDFQMF